MQINGVSQSSAFITRSSEAREPVRPPIIIDAEPKAREARPLLPAATKASPFQTALTVDVERDERQEKFIRLFSENEVDTQAASFESNALPRGVEEYLQIADVNSEPQQRLFDEIV